VGFQGCSSMGLRSPLMHPRCAMGLERQHGLLSGYCGAVLCCDGVGKCQEVL